MELLILQYQLIIIVKKNGGYMYMLLEVQDEKVAFLIEKLKEFSYVKYSQNIDENLIDFFNDINESVDYVKLAKKGLVQKNDAFEFLNGI